MSTETNQLKSIADDVLSEKREPVVILDQVYIYV